MLRVPGIARRRPWRVERRPAVRELGHRELAEEDAAGGVQSRRDRRVLARDIVDAYFRVPRGQDAGGVVQILEREWNAVQRPAVAAGRDLRLGRTRLAQGEIRRHGNERVQLRLERLDARELGAHELDRRESTRGDERCRIGKGNEIQFGCV